ncbi:MAG TPA: GNAT family N-acetyltransferase [Nitrososphaerales archaeon]|nr:GNAT family N-acetyltransferase [Nitrososphaerales archaeon]
MLENERSFASLFAETVRLNNSTLYFNESLSEDPVFNHLVLDDSLLSDENVDRLTCEKAFEQANQTSRSLSIPLTLFIEDFWRNSTLVEEIAIDSGFRVIERMHILSKPIADLAACPSGSESGEVRVFLTTDATLWNRVFMESFSIPEQWGPELLRRVKEIIRADSAALVLATLGSSGAVGCTLLHEKPEGVMGVYCVGTIFSARSRGVARAMMRASENIAREAGCTVMVIQTLERDNVTGMYVDKFGYTINFSRNLLSRS